MIWTVPEHHRRSLDLGRTEGGRPDLHRSPPGVGPILRGDSLDATVEGRDRCWSLSRRRDPVRHQPADRTCTGPQETRKADRPCGRYDRHRRSLRAVPASTISSRDEVLVKRLLAIGILSVAYRGARRGRAPPQGRRAMLAGLLVRRAEAGISYRATAGVQRTDEARHALDAWAQQQRATWTRKFEAEGTYPSSRAARAPAPSANRNRRRGCATATASRASGSS